MADELTPANKALVERHRSPPAGDPAISIRPADLNRMLNAARAQGPGEAVAREDIERVIAEADRRLAYSMSLVRLVDGDHTYRLSIDGETLLFTDSETPDWNAHDRLLAHIAECKGRVRADAILELFSKPLAATPTREGRMQITDEAVEAAARAWIAEFEPRDDPSLEPPTETERRAIRAALETALPHLRGEPNDAADPEAPGEHA